MLSAKAKLVMVIVATAVAGCCGKSPTGPTGGQSTAVVQITGNPQTIVYAVCPVSHYGTLAGQLEIEGALAIRETAGVNITATRLMLTIRRRSDNAAIASNDVIGASAPIRVTASGSTSVPIAMHFDASAAEANMKIVVLLEGTDANGHAITASTEVEIRAP